MLEPALSDQLLLGEARSIQKILNRFDHQNMGNDMVVIITK